MIPQAKILTRMTVVYVPIANKISLHGTKETSLAISFTAEEEILFTRWYENIQWIEQNHYEDRLISLFLM